MNIVTVLLFFFFIDGSRVLAEFPLWHAPFNDSSKFIGESIPCLQDPFEVYRLCNNEMDMVILGYMPPEMAARQSANYDVVGYFLSKEYLCWDNYARLVPGKYRMLLWLMRSLKFCEISQLQPRPSDRAHYRQLQRDFLRYSYALICSKTRLLAHVEEFQLFVYSGFFRLLYERNNPERAIVCSTLVTRYDETFDRCYVPKPTLKMLLFQQRCLTGEYHPLFGLSSRSRLPDSPPSSDDIMPATAAASAGTARSHDRFVLTLPRVFERFGAACTSIESFVHSNPVAISSLGAALANDTLFMSFLTDALMAHVSTDSELQTTVLKTRLLLQHYALAAIKLDEHIQLAQSCVKQQREQDLLYSINATSESDGDSDSESGDFQPSDDAVNLTSYSTCCAGANARLCEIEDTTEYSSIARDAWRGLYVEATLLCLICVNTVLLTFLLLKTRKHLSTATILFVCNIVFSNLLFLASFALLFDEILSIRSYATVNEDFADKSPELVVAETLQMHLFTESQFRRHLVQETLFSLAQNGSLLGLIHLLLLVLVVINRSMTGHSTYLARRSVITVFASVWLFLITSHLIFSTMQISAIRNLDDLFSLLGSEDFPSSVDCDAKEEPASAFSIIGSLCDSAAVFHATGAYLLRGHTIFTGVFLSVGVLIFVSTVAFHWRVRRVNRFLRSGLREQYPYQRREMLFHTLLLSIATFFVSVLGQTYIELAVVWEDDKNRVAQLARWYHVARIAAFLDPLFNPLIVVLRTPLLRKQMGREWESVRRSRDSSSRVPGSRSTRSRSSRRDNRARTKSGAVFRNGEVIHRSADDESELSVRLRSDHKDLQRSLSSRSTDSRLMNSIV